jgi:hypothetical protein
MDNASPGIVRNLAARALTSVASQRASWLNWRRFRAGDLPLLVDEGEHHGSVEAQGLLLICFAAGHGQEGRASAEGCI